MLNLWGYSTVFGGIQPQCAGECMAWLMRHRPTCRMIRVKGGMEVTVDQILTFAYLSSRALFVAIGPGGSSPVGPSRLQLDPWYKCTAASKGFLDLTGNQADHVVEVQVLIFALDLAEITPATLNPRAKERLKRVLNGLTNMFYVTGGTNGSQYNARADVVQYVLDTCRAGLSTARMLDNILEQYRYELPRTVQALQELILASRPTHSHSASMKISAIVILLTLYAPPSVISLCFGHETNATHTSSSGRAHFSPAPTEVHVQWQRADFELDPWFKCAAAQRKYLYRQTRDAAGNPNGVVQEHFDEFADLTGNQADHVLEIQVLINALDRARITPADLVPDAKTRLKTTLNGYFNMIYVTGGTNGSKGVTIRNILDGQQYAVRRDVAQYMLLTCRNALDTARILDNILRSYSHRLPWTVEYTQQYILAAANIRCPNLHEDDVQTPMI
ncbi:unnamed protein product [Cyclocybe aegerita]|uniref:Uncharacterized protein n=1 Tax=Cyclocybe aegerita TaxID=1973307 RepID=A0A8S0WDA2_CYCAE|nr:unnamed protein product [Cyclocybe aegerita]